MTGVPVTFDLIGSEILKRIAEPYRAAPHRLVAADIDDRIVFVNLVCEEIYGFGEADLIDGVPRPGGSGPAHGPIGSCYDYARRMLGGRCNQNPQTRLRIPCRHQSEHT